MKHWRIRGYDGLTVIYEKHVLLWHIGERQVHALLQRLTAQAGLTLEEIMDASISKAAPSYRPLLSVHREGTTWMCGENPHFVAQIVECDEAGDR